MDWQLLRVPAFRALWRGRALSWVGNGVAPIALSFAVLDLGGDAVDLGLVLAARSLPNLVLVLFGAAAVGRLPQRRVTVGASAAAALALVGAAVLLLVGRETMTTLAVVAAVVGVAAALFAPASQAVLRVALPEHRQREGAALNRVAMNVGLVVGTALGGALVGAAGTAAGLFGAAVALVAAAGVFTRLPRGVVGTPLGPETWSGTARRLGQGLGFVARTPWLAATALLVLVLQVAVGAGVHVFGPLAVDGAFGGAAPLYGYRPVDLSSGRTAWGFAGAVQTVGLLVGAAAAVALRGRLRLAAGCAAVALTALPLGVVALSPGPTGGAVAFVDPVHWAVALVLALGLSGLALEMLSVPLDRAVRDRVPATWSGRVWPVLTLASLGGAPLGELVAGPLAALLGQPGALLGLAGLVVVAAVTVALTGRVRRVDRPVPDGSRGA